MKIIPAIDIINGKCVRLTQGDYSRSEIYNESPLDVAMKFEQSGFKYLHLVDLDGAKSSHIVNHKVLYEIVSNTRLNVDFGGGIKSDGDIETAFNCGAHQITAGSIAVTNQQLFLKWLHRYGPERIILGADYSGRRVAIQGWQHKSDLDIMDFISYYESCGIKNVICTDISKDGMLKGVSTNIYTEIIYKSDVKLIASGGVSSIDDVIKLKETGCNGVIIGKALYAGKINITELLKIC